MEFGYPISYHHISFNTGLMLRMDLMTSHRNYQWLRNPITGDDKWVLYINYTHRHQWPSPDQTGVATPKADLHSTRR